MMHCLKLGLRDLQEPGRLIAADAGLSTPAAHLADGFRVVPRCSDAGFADAVERLCRDEGVGLIVPTIDTELAVYADARQRFEAVGVRVAVSSPETVAIAADKRVTNRWLRENGFPAVRHVTFDLPAIVLAQVAVACAFAVRTMRVTFDQIDPRCEQVALTLGCTQRQAFWSVILPQAVGRFGTILVDE